MPDNLDILQKKANVLTRRIRMPSGCHYLYFITTKDGKLLNDGQSMDREELVEWLEERCKKIFQGEKEDTNR